MGPKPNKQKSKKEQILMMRKKMTKQKRSSFYGCTTLNKPNLVWSQKLSRVRPG
jgi:hypothetical protein